LVWKFPPFIFLLAFVSLGQAEVLLNRGSDWRYLKGTPMLGDWLAEDFDDSAWPSAAAGKGHSIKIIDPLANPNNPTNWKASPQKGGSPRY